MNSQRSPAERTPLMPCVVLTLVLVATTGSSRGEDEAGPGLNRPLRVLTTNIWNYAEPYDIRMTLLREQIEEMNPDVIGFQEAGWKPGEDHHSLKYS